MATLLPSKVVGNGIRPTPYRWVRPTALVIVTGSFCFLAVTWSTLTLAAPAVSRAKVIPPVGSPPAILSTLITVTLPLITIDPNLSRSNSRPAGWLGMATSPAHVLISEFLYDGLPTSTDGDEFVELCNPNGAPVELIGYKVGDEPEPGGPDSMYLIPDGVTMAPQDCLVIAKNADQFVARFGLLPDFELVVGQPGYTDHWIVPNLSKYRTWARGSWSLANQGDEILVLGPADEVVDSVAYGRGDYPGLGLVPEVKAPYPNSLQRIWPFDTNLMAHDFVSALPSPKKLTWLPSPPTEPALPASLPGGMRVYWGQLNGHTSYADGAGPPFYALAQARAAGLHFYAITDPGRLLSQAEWTNFLAECQAATVTGQFIAIPGVEWDHSTTGHISVFYGDNPLSANDPLFDTLPELYTWLAFHPAVIAQFNQPDTPSFFDSFAFNPAAAPQLLLQEIGYDAAVRNHYESAFVRSQARGWRVAPTFNSAGEANWGSETPVRTGLVAPALTETDLAEALRARRVFATEDNNLALALRLGDAWMGSVLTVTGRLPLMVDVVDPDIEPVTLWLYDRTTLLATVLLTSSTGEWTTTVEAYPGHYFWLKAVQADNQAAYSAPIWIAGEAPPDRLYLNELLPGPKKTDWDGNGVVDDRDEWIEGFNPAGFPLDLGEWKLVDAAGHTYTFPLGTIIPAGGFIIFYRGQTHLSLNNSKDSLTLIRPDGTTADTFSYTRSPGFDRVWCRLPDGGPDWSDECEPSPGAANWRREPPAVVTPTPGPASWKQDPSGPLTVSIYNARRLTRNAWVRIKGRVTAPPGLLGAREMYIQDRTGGIQVYLPKDHRLFFNLGDRVEVVGKLRVFHEEFRIVVSARSDVEFLEPGQPPPPLPIATTSLLEPYEGLLVMLQGQAANRFEGYSTFWVDDGTGPAKVYLDSDTGINQPALTPGTPVTIVGIAGQYSTGDPSREDYRLRPRYPADLVAPIAPIQELPLINWPMFLPETGS